MKNENHDFEATVRKAIREIDDPEELRKHLTALIEQRFPALPPFAQGERMKLHEFIDRFKRHYCNGTEPCLWNWPVTIVTVIEPDLVVVFEHQRK